MFGKLFKFKIKFQDISQRITRVKNLHSHNKNIYSLQCRCNQNMIVTLSREDKSDTV